MRSKYLYTLVILIAILTVGLVNSITNNKGMSKVYAFVQGYIPQTPYYNEVSPYTVNDFENDHVPVTMLYPPLASEGDYKGWKGTYFGITPYPTPPTMVCGVSTCFPDTMVPCTRHNQQFTRVVWTGNNYINPQYLHLTNYANSTPGAYGKNFENIGCGGGSVTATGNVTYTAGDWGCYSYIRLYTYLNFGANNGAPADVSQRVSLYDGSITFTSGTINLDVQGFNPAVSCGSWVNHLTVSLNFLANHYDVGTGRYFSVTNITDVIIPAPETNYGFYGLPTPTTISAFPSADSRSLILYYDWLVLGDSISVPIYQSPADITVTTAFGTVLNSVDGALLRWIPLSAGSYDAAVPPTAYHIYKSLSNTTGMGPYISLAIVPNNVSVYVDTTNDGGAIACYKILTCNNGPTLNVDDEKRNTINATYNEPLLNDTIVVEQCGYVLAKISSTSTPTEIQSPVGTSTMTWTPGYYTSTPTMTWTEGYVTPSITMTLTPATATATQTIAPTVLMPLADAHIYPNPYNPNSVGNYGGSGLFHVENIQSNTKIHLYAMDGSFVKDILFTSAKGFVWDGTNKNGSKVVSGLYYVVLEDDQKKTVVMRLIVCYKCDPVYKP